MKSKYKFIFTLIITLLILYYFFLYIKKNPQIIFDLRLLPAKIILLIFILQIFNIIFNTFINYLIFKFKKKIPLSDCFSTTLIAAFLNIFLPLRSGTTLQAVYLKKKFNLSLIWFTGSFYAVSVILLSIIALLGIASLIYLFTHNTKISLIILAIFFFFSASAIFLSLIKKTLSLILSQWPNKYLIHLLRVIIKIDRGLKIITKKQAMFIRLFILILLSIINLYLITFLEFRAINLNHNLAFIFLFFSLSVFSIFLNFTPSSLGIREFIQIFFSKVLNIDQNNIIKLAIIDRALLFFTLFILIIIILPLQIIKKKSM